jgi:hypothetical protein
MTSPYRARLFDALYSISRDGCTVDIKAAVAAIEPLIQEILNELVADVFRERSQTE